MKNVLAFGLLLVLPFLAKSQNLPLFQCGPGYPVPPMENYLANTANSQQWGSLFHDGVNLNVYYVLNDTASVFTLTGSGYSSYEVSGSFDGSGLFAHNGTVYHADLHGLYNYPDNSYFPFPFSEPRRIVSTPVSVGNDLWFVVMDTMSNVTPQRLLKFDGTAITSFNPPVDTNDVWNIGPLFNIGTNLYSNGILYDDLSFYVPALFRFNLSTNAFDVFEPSVYPNWSMEQYLDWTYLMSPNFFKTGDGKILAAMFNPTGSYEAQLYTQTFDGVQWSPMTSTLFVDSTMFASYHLILHGTDDLSLFENFGNDIGRINLFQKLAGNYINVGYVNVGTATNPLDTLTSYLKPFWLDPNNNLYILSNAAFNDQIQCGGTYVQIKHDPVPFGTGLVYHDANQNSTFDSGDYPLPNRQVCAPFYCNTTDTSGHYGVILSTGANTVTPPSIPNFASAPAAHSVTNPSGIVENLDFGFQATSAVTDLAVTHVYSSPPRIGFFVNQSIGVYNAGTLAASDTLVYTFDSLYTFLLAEPSPFYQTGNTVAWLTGNINPLQSKEFGLILQLSETTALGTLIVNHATVTAVNDNDAANDEFAFYQTAVSSFDPNDKTPSPFYFVSDGDPIQYTVRFQNTGTDTAFNIIIRDTLSENLDWSGFQLLTQSHPVTVDFNLENGALAFRFHNILLPDSNINEPLSHGYVVYAVPTKAPLADGTPINNTGSIYFDFNAPVVTNTTFNVIGDNVGIEELHQGVLTVYPNPASHQIQIHSSKFANRITMKDLTGRLVYAGDYDVSNPFVDVSMLPAGVFMMELSNGDALVTRAKFAVVR